MTKNVAPPVPTAAAKTVSARPERPSLRSTNPAPVLVKEPPPFVVRISEFLWALSLLAGGITVVYFFVERQAFLDAISAFVKTVDDSRKQATYEAAAELIHWFAFAFIICLLLVQITQLVSFVNRRPGTRWWQLGTLLVQVGLYALLGQFLGDITQAQQLRQLVLAQTGLATLALLMSTLRSALAWTAKRYDVGRVGIRSMSAEQ